MIVSILKETTAQLKSREMSQSLRLGGSIKFNINPKTACGPSCSHFYTLNLAGICTRKPATYPQDTLQADGYTENGGKMSWPKRPKLLVTRPNMNGRVHSLQGSKPQ